eukprot:3433378-Prymnesium_polylepis.1
MGHDGPVARHTPAKSRPGRHSHALSLDEGRAPHMPRNHCARGAMQRAVLLRRCRAGVTRAQK